MTPERGTTLVELLVVLALVGIMVVAAALLITHSIGLLGAAGRAVRNPDMVHVNERIRRDIQEAEGLAAVEMIWSDHPLEIRTHDSSLIMYSVCSHRRFRRSGSRSMISSALITEATDAGGGAAEKISERALCLM